MSLKKRLPSDVINHIIEPYVQDPYSNIKKVILDNFVSLTGCFSDEIVERDAMYVYYSLLPYADVAQIEDDLINNLTDIPDYYNNDDNPITQKRHEMNLVIGDIMAKISHFQPWVKKYLDEENPDMIDFLDSQGIPDELLGAFVADYRLNERLNTSDH